MSALPSDRSYALDWARVGAMALVATQHAMSLLHHDDWTDFLGLNVGQFGVSIFMVLSGFFSATDRRSPRQWLWRRLNRLFPAYWIAMGVCFFATWIFGYKPFTVGQVISQMLGIGLFTHGNQLVNVASWFISLLLACYFLVFMCRLWRWPLCAASLLSAVLIGAAMANFQSLICVHMASFFISFTVINYYNTSARSNLAFALIGAGLALLGHFDPILNFTAASLILIAAIRAVPFSWPKIDFLSRYTYEFYLVHGIFFVGALLFLPLPVGVRILFAVAGAYAGAICLHWLTQRVVERTSQRIGIPTIAKLPT